MVEVTHEDLLRAVAGGDLVQLEAWKVAGASLLNDGKNVDADTNFKFILFIFGRVKLEVLLWLLKDTKFIDPTAHAEELVGKALERGYVEILDWLNSVVGTPSVVNFADSIFLFDAIANNHSKSAEWVVSKAAEIGYTLRDTSLLAQQASLYGQLDLLKIILYNYGHVESVPLEWLLYNTSEYGFLEMAEWLILYSKINISSHDYFLSTLEEPRSKNKNVAVFFDLIRDFISSGVTLEKLRLYPRIVDVVATGAVTIEDVSMFSDEQLQVIQNPMPKASNCRRIL